MRHEKLIILQTPKENVPRNIHKRAKILRQVNIVFISRELL